MKIIDLSVKMTRGMYEMRQGFFKDTKLSALFFLQLAVCLYTFSGIAAKFASSHPFFSLEFIFWFGLEFVFLVIYALAWQQIIKKIDISIAYSNRALAIFWSMLWAAFIFREQITLQNVCGVLIIAIGVWVVNSDD